MAIRGGDDGGDVPGGGGRDGDGGGGHGSSSQTQTGRGQSGFHGHAFGHP